MDVKASEGRPRFAWDCQPGTVLHPDKNGTAYHSLDKLPPQVEQFGRVDGELVVMAAAGQQLGLDFRRTGEPLDQIVEFGLCLGDITPDKLGLSGEELDGDLLWSAFAAFFLESSTGRIYLDTGEDLVQEIIIVVPAFVLTDFRFETCAVSPLIDANDSDELTWLEDGCGEFAAQRVHVDRLEVAEEARQVLCRLAKDETRVCWVRIRLWDEIQTLCRGQRAQGADAQNRQSSACFGSDDQREGAA